MAFKIPTVNELIALAIGLVIISFVAKLLPENVKSLFRV